MQQQAAAWRGVQATSRSKERLVGLKKTMCSGRFKVVRSCGTSVQAGWMMSQSLGEMPLQAVLCCNTYCGGKLCLPEAQLCHIDRPRVQKLHADVQADRLSWVAASAEAQDDVHNH